MSQEVKRIKMEDKKAMKKFVFIMVSSLIVGGFIGVGLVFVKFYGIEMVNQVLEQILQVVLTYGMPVVTVGITVAVIAIYVNARKEFKSWDGESEEPIDKVESRLSYALWLVAINIIWNYFVFGAAFCSHYWDAIQNEKILGNVVVMTVFFIASIFITVVEQQKIVNLEKEINPEKMGSVYDTKFQKKWEESCDEAERLQIYKCGYKAYRVTYNLCIGLWVFCVLGGFIWEFGIVPVLMVTVIWAVMVTVYSMESIRYSKKGK